jgi:hypothetical protein
MSSIQGNPPQRKSPKYGSQDESYGQKLALSMQEYPTRVGQFSECIADINAGQLPVCQLVVLQELIEFIVLLGFKESLQLA